jgi:hypothetical protein
MAVPPGGLDQGGEKIVSPLGHQGEEQLFFSHGEKQSEHIIHRGRMAGDEAEYAAEEVAVHKVYVILDNLKVEGL